METEINLSEKVKNYIDNLYGEDLIKYMISVEDSIIQDYWLTSFSNYQEEQSKIIDSKTNIYNYIWSRANSLYTGLEILSLEQKIKKQ